MRIIFLILACLSLSSCETLKEMQDSEGLKKVGAFQLNPVQVNSYWYNGASYEYNEYKIEITSEPVEAKIRWGDKMIGTTPLIYPFSGTLDRDEKVVVRAIPMDENLPAQEAVLKIRTELPKKIHFNLKNQ